MFKRALKAFLLGILRNEQPRQDHQHDNDHRFNHSRPPRSFTSSVLHILCQFVRVPFPLGRRLENGENPGNRKANLQVSLPFGDIFNSTIPE
jgi:hypothetical protein